MTPLRQRMLEDMQLSPSGGILYSFGFRQRPTNNPCWTTHSQPCLRHRPSQKLFRLCITNCGCQSLICGGLWTSHSSPSILTTDIHLGFDPTIS